MYQLQIYTNEEDGHKNGGSNLYSLCGKIQKYDSLLEITSHDGQFEPEMDFVG